MCSATARAATPCSAGGCCSAATKSRWPTSILPRSAPRGLLAREVQGFAWLRDLAASASRDKGARLAEAIAGRWLIAHGTRVDEAWAPELWGERILFWTAYAPYILSSRDAGYRSALLNTLARGAKHLDATADKAPPGLPRITAWAGRAGRRADRAGRPLAPVACGIRPDARRWPAAQFEDGGLMSRSPQEQMLLVDRLGLVRAAYFAAKQTLPDALENAASAALAALHGVTMGDNALSQLAGRQSRRSGTAWRRWSKAAGFAPGRCARRAAGVISGCRRSARSSSSTPHRRRPPRMAATGCASTLAMEISDGAQRLVVNCGGPGPVPTDAVRRAGAGAAHAPPPIRRWSLDDTNSTAILPDGSLGKGVADVAIERSEDNDCSRIEASHDGYVKGFGLIHQRRLSLGNDGKEVRGEDRLIAKGRRKIREAAPYAIRFHLAPGVEATVTADGMGAILRSSGAPPWNFRCRGAMLQVEESLFIDGRGQPIPTLQLVVVGEISAIGGEIAWQFRRSS